MSVVAKFFVQGVDRAEGSSTATQVRLGAVCRGVENAVWSQYTPSGTITMGVLNEAATAYFEPGAEYRVIFERVAKPERGDGHPLKVIETKHGALICETCGLYPTWSQGHGQGEPNWSQHDEMYGRPADAEAGQ